MSHPPLRTDGHPRLEAIPPVGVSDPALHFAWRISPPTAPRIEACLTVSIDGLPKQGIAWPHDSPGEPPAFPQHCSGAADPAAPLLERSCVHDPHSGPGDSRPARYRSNRQATTTQTVQKEL
jgi:hypothetical protein